MEGLRDRTKEFSLRIIRLYTALPKTTEAQVIGKQMLRSGTSVAANFREASRARSTAEFVAKLGIVEQELDETMLWLELIVETEIMRRELVESLHGEAEELLKIVITSIRKSRSRGRKSDNSL
ncbi:MAG: four helix bundle protein [Planctomycetes bacterium]|nr:four helix bundle protein [Planctomycetota bacterium]